eukprot:GDKJ01034540.1.p1 GENE.GDKJ01034540.1~~GDKJ01034540.1.p1  ORF type:complete len:279 (-),score=-9.68 GDKJ01034540.1:126-962(-)
MKIGCYVILFFLALVANANPVLRTAPKRVPLNGKVKIVRESGYSGLDSAVATYSAFNWDFYSVDSFSIDGLIQYARFVEKGVVKNETRYIYNTSGKVVEQLYYDFEDSGKVTMVTKYSYSNDGSINEEIVICGGVQTSSIKYNYKLGLLRTMYRNGIDTSYYYYNDIGQLIRFDQKYNGHEGVNTTRYVYDGIGRITSETLSISGESTTTTYTYDEHNNEVLAVEHENGDSFIRSFASEYVYDSQGNWIRCLEDIPIGFLIEDNRRPKGLSIREIEYY